MADASATLNQTTIPAIAPIGSPAATTVAPANTITPSAVNSNGYSAGANVSGQAVPIWRPTDTSPISTPTNTGYTAATSTSGQTTPTFRTVDPNQTVQGQVKNIVDDNSPLIQQARAGAISNMNNRGLLNSSMAEGAADSAVYSAALPIAQQDANTFSTAASNNQSVANQADQFNVSQGNQTAAQNAANINQASNAGLSAATQNYATQTGALTSLSNASTSAASQRYSTDISASTAIQNAQLSATTQTALANLDATTKTKIQNLSDQNSQLLQSSQSAASAFNLYMNTVAQISQSTTMDAAAKNTAMQNAYDNINQQFQVISQIDGSDLSKYFVPSGNTSTQFVDPPPPPPPAWDPSTVGDTNFPGGA